ncbi:MAG: ribonuclease HII [Bacteroidetes bacterium]|uniref:Ribonuclease HII n=1 Tax=Candidatus Cryptobacteroides merdavium TaxID=2840769 RepID=A0A9D9EHB2_9BACT|nr:ribonuclease HII [Candidatus Cryptobacteroides merdavium]
MVNRQDKCTKEHIGLPCRLHNDLLETGCDEAGRGPLAGPVFAAAVILPPDFHHPLLNDSKKMTEKSREILREVVMKEAIAYAVEAVSAEEIDKINILNASIAGMWRAIMNLPVRPEHIVVDGNRFKPYIRIPSVILSDRSIAVSRMNRAAGPVRQLQKTMSQKECLPWENPALAADYGTTPFECIVKGDGKFADIAAASVLAKTGRDAYMRSLAEEYPQYGWERNMGYPTREHIEAVRKYGLTPHHRKSFHLKELEPVLF